MAQFRVHPSVEDDLQKAPPPDPANWMVDTRMDEFLEELEDLSDRPDYRRVWPPRIAGIGERSVGGQVYGTVGAVTIYGWEREGYVVCVEERIELGNQPSFRLQVVQHGVSPASAMDEAERRARTPW